MWIYLIWFAHSSLYGHLAIVENAAPDTGVCGFMRTCTSNSLLSLGIELLIFRGTSKVFAEQVHRHLSGSQSLYTHAVVCQRSEHDGYLTVVLTSTSPATLGTFSCTYWALGIFLG